MKKRLYRSRDNKIVFGILGGLGEYFQLDPTLLRLVFVVLLLFTAVFPLSLAYLLAYLIVPPPPEDGPEERRGPPI